jgi:hypothetical protein
MDHFTTVKKSLTCCVTENEGGKAQTAVCPETSDANISCVAISPNKYILLQSGHHALQQSRLFSLSFACCFFPLQYFTQISLPRSGRGNTWSWWSSFCGGRGQRKPVWQAACPPLPGTPAGRCVSCQSYTWRRSHQPHMHEGSAPLDWYLQHRLDVATTTKGNPTSRAQMACSTSTPQPDQDQVHRRFAGDQSLNPRRMTRTARKASDRNSPRIRHPGFLPAPPTRARRRRPAHHADESLPCRRYSPVRGRGAWPGTC